VVIFDWYVKPVLPPVVAPRCLVSYFSRRLVTLFLTSYNLVTDDTTNVVGLGFFTAKAFGSGLGSAKALGVHALREMGFMGTIMGNIPAELRYRPRDTGV
jgi:hypothetical protein